ncbi:uncharacterized protein LAJ45_11577 [Morchella importuna]|nr:uncharacterized protein LAJ45_11577 [Morchella importuna]KAH8144447.1 hypothetical protein LAJ45_11577 [Morchella importuna]
MPEGITYYDMKRMIEAQVPAGTYRLDLHPRWFRADNGTLFNANLIECMKGRSFQFSGAGVEHWGKALGIPLADGIWLRVQFALHGHGLPASTEEYLSMVKAWDDHPNSEFNTTVLGAIVGEEMTVLLVDR